jgi:3-phytase
MMSRPVRQGLAAGASLAVLALGVAFPALASAPAGPGSASVPALVETSPTPGDGATGTVFWLDPADPGASLLIGGDENDGIGLYDLAGNQLQYLPDGKLKHVDLRYGVLVGSERVDLVVASVEGEPRLRFYRLDPEARALAFVDELATGIATDGVCFYHSPFTGQLFVIATSDDGELEQWRVDFGDGRLRGQLAREFAVGSEAASCVADDETGNLFVSEEEIGIWRFGAEPEAGRTHRLVDFAGPYPPGANILEQVEGLALVAYPDGAGYLVASNEKADALNLYRRDGNNEFVGRVTIGAGTGIDGASEPQGVAVLPLAIGDRFPAGVMATTDDTNTDPDADKAYKLASWADVLAAVGEPVEASSLPVRREPMPLAGQSRVPSVVARIETEPVPKGLDAADDPAIYVHPSDPSLSAVIGTDKTGALVVYDLDGGRRQELPIGRVNNVDLRDGFIVDGTPRTLVATVNRTDNSLWLYTVDEEHGTLVEAHREPIPSDVNEVYGVCLYRQPDGGDLFAFVNSTDTGEVEQYRLVAGSDGIEAERVRELVVGSQTEGCVVDDTMRVLYIGEETVGIWKYGADPDAGDDRVLVDAVRPDGNLVADVEGLALAPGAEDAGYLVASSQGESLFAVYERGGDNRFLGKFRIIDSPDGPDAVSGTDGIDISLAALPAPFEGGMLVVQDDFNREPVANQNFKLLRWVDVLEAMGLG